MVDPLPFDRVLQRADDGVLPDDVTEGLRPVFARERLVGHVVWSLGGGLSESQFCAQIKPEAWPTNAARLPARSEEPRPDCVTQGNTLSLLPSGPDEVRCACCTGPGLIPASRKTGRDCNPRGRETGAIRKNFPLPLISPPPPFPGPSSPFSFFPLFVVSGVRPARPGPLLDVAALAGGTRQKQTLFLLPLPAGPRVRANAHDALFAIAVSAPVFVYLIATWRQEFPYLGDQWLHNACAIEAYAFWWPWGWIAAVLAITFVVWRIRHSEDSPAALIGLAVVVGIGLAASSPLSFAARYPGTLHFFSVPLRAVMHASSPLNVERLINALSIPIWLLVLRPLIVRRHIDITAMTIAAFLFWQKDNVYYFTSGYLEPWAIVLLLTAGEHLVRFGAEAVWRSLLLLGAAAMVKEQLILSLPIVAAVYFPFRGSRRAQLEHLLVTVVAATPFILFWRARELFKTWGVARPVTAAFGAEHAALFRTRVSLQFGVALPLVIAAFVLLIVLAIRRRAFAALLFVAIADGVVLYFAKILQPWAGYPRLNLVPLAVAAIALGYVAESVAERRRVASAAIALIAIVLNGIGLASAMRDAFRPSSARNFIEHFDSPFFFPIREALNGSALPAGSRVDVLTNGKRIFQFFWAGPLEDQYPDLAARYRLRSGSFTGVPARCRCTDQSVAQLAVFIRFTNLGSNVPQRAATEAEASQCATELRRTCGRVTQIENEGVLVGLLGAR